TGWPASSRPFTLVRSIAKTRLGSDFPLSLASGGGGGWAWMQGSGIVAASATRKWSSWMPRITWQASAVVESTGAATSARRHVIGSEPIKNGSGRVGARIDPRVRAAKKGLALRRFGMADRGRSARKQEDDRDRVARGAGEVPALELREIGGAAK